MNLDVDPDRFRSELGGWALRVILCALPSAGLAALEFHDPFELAAMATGVAVYVFGAAWFCSWVVMQATPAREQFVRSLKMAASFKAALLLLAACGWGLSAGLKVNGADGLMLGLLPDAFAGFGSLRLVSLLSGDVGFGHLHGFAWIFGATMVQGALISAGLALVAAILYVTRAYEWLMRAKGSPASIWG